MIYKYHSNASYADRFIKKSQDGGVAMNRS